MNKKIIIIGGVAVGMTIAAKLSRSKADDLQHVVYEKRKYASLGACGIPFYIGNKSAPSSSLIARTVEEHIKNGVNLKVNHEVINVDYEKKKVLVQNLNTQEKFWDHYDELIISTGAKPFKPDIKDFEKYDEVSYATTLEDAIKIKENIQKKEVKNVLVIGGGFIGVEMAESMIHQNKPVTIIELADHIMKGIFDKEIRKELESKISSQAKLKLTEQVIAIDKGDNDFKLKVITNKSEYLTDFVIICIGFIPNTQIFKNDNLEMLQNGAIVIDDYGKTTLPNVWAAGDCATVKNKITKKNEYIPLATTARKLSDVIVQNLLGKKNKFFGTLGSSGLRFVNCEAFSSGITEHKAQALNMNVITIFISMNDTSEYTDGISPLFLKLIALKDGTLIGAQCFGSGKSAALRMAALSMAIWNGMNVKDLTQFDLFYTPVFTKATDIVHVAARQLSKKIVST